MEISAELRWFWRDACPKHIEKWFCTSGEPPGGGRDRPPRLDRYFHSKGTVELGIKIRDEVGGRPPDVEVKGLVCKAADVQVWCKWKAPPAIAVAGGVAVNKTRWLRKFSADSDPPFEVKLGHDEKPLDNTKRPKVGCNLELTEVKVDGRPEIWWSLCFEAFGDLQSAPDALTKIIRMLKPPDFNGALLSYPEWLDKLELGPLDR
jgi:hypothetical protein